MVNQTKKANILAAILEYCDLETQNRLMKGLTPFLLKKNRPDILESIRSKIILFEDLANANSAGIVLLLKYVNTKDLAISLIGAPEEVIKRVGACISKNTFKDLKLEIDLQKNSSQQEVEKARARILREAKILMQENRLYIERPDEPMIN